VGSNKKRQTWAFWLVEIGVLLLLLIIWMLSSRILLVDSPISPVTPSPVDPPVALVEGQPIRRSSWIEAVLLDWAMSRLAGIQSPSPEETLDRLVNELLILRAVPSLPEPDPGEIEAQITALEAAWGVTGKQVDSVLGEVGLSRRVLELSIARLLKVQHAQAILESQGTPIQSWLAQERTRARVVIYWEQTRVTFRFPTPTVTSTP